MEIWKGFIETISNQDIRISCKTSFLKHRLPTFCTLKLDTSSKQHFYCPKLCRFNLVCLFHLCKQMSSYFSWLAEPVCYYSEANKITKDFLLHFSNFLRQRQSFLKSFGKINSSFLWTKLLRYGDKNMSASNKPFFLNSVLDDMPSTK